MRKNPAIITLATMAIAGMAAYAQQGRMAQILPPKATVFKVSEINENRVNDLIRSKAVQGQTVLMSQTWLEEGAKSPHHNHPEEELIVVISGRLRAMTSEGYVIMEPGDMYVIESYAEHQVEALEDTLMIEAFGPGRVVGVTPQ